MLRREESTVKVCIRLRSSESCCSSHWLVKEGRSIQLANSHAEPKVFDYVFDEGATNQEVFDRMAQHIVRSCVQGYNGTILAYGQTLSGKTYTMMGDGKSPGLIVLAAKKIFQTIAMETSRDFKLRASYIEIYNEKVNDLLNKKHQDLEIHETGVGIVTVDSKECIITSEDDLMRIICPGNKGRTVGEAQTPERSGHSHTILRIVSCLKEIFRLLQQNDLDPKQIIESWRSDRSGDILQSNLSLIDLAGSERLSGDSPTRVTDAVQINKTLMFLGNVVKKLSNNTPEKNTYISFRDCKLTRFLQASLCGNCFTSIICTIRTGIIEESQSTLNFAVRARKIRINPQVNRMEPGTTTMIKRVDSEMKKLRDQLAEEKQKKDKLKVQILESKLVTEKLTSIKPESQRAGTSKTSRLPRPKFDLDFLAGPPLDLAHNTKSTGTDDLPIHYHQLMQKCADLQKLNEKLKSFFKSVEMDLEQTFNTHNAQGQQLEIHLLTSISGGDLNIQELQRSFNNLYRLVLRIGNMQADFEAIQQKYDSLQEKHTYLERSSQASEEECQLLQAENKSLRLEIAALKERAEGAQRMLLAASSQESLAEDFKAKLECQTTELVTYQESFEGFQGECECLSNQLSESVKENNMLREELRSMKASIVSTDQGPDTHDDLLEQRQKLAANATRIDLLQNRCEKLTESLKQAEARQEQTISSSEYEKQIKKLRESLREAKDELKLKEEQKTDDELESQESKDQYEREVAKLKKKLSRVTDRCEAEKLELRQENNALKEKILEAAENQQQMDVAHSMELEKVRAGLQDQLRQAEDERNKALDELTQMRSSQEEYARHREETQLEAVSNENKKLVASQEQIQELQQKYDQLATYADNLRDEKSVLQVKIDEAYARHSSTIRKYHELQMKMYDVGKLHSVTEKSNFEEKLETMTAQIGLLKQELKSAGLKEHEDLKLSVSEETDVPFTLHENVDSLQSELLTKSDFSSRDLEMEKLRSDLKLALEAKNTASAEKLDLTSKFQAVEQRMASQAGKFEKELADLKSNTIELQLKLKSLEEQNDNLESENDQLKVKLKNAHNLQNQLEEEQKLCASLRTQSAELKETKTRLEEQLQNKEAEASRKFLEMNQIVKLGLHSIEELTKESERLRCDLQTKTNSFLKERDGLEATLSTLSKKNKQLEERISSLNLNSNSIDRNTELITKLRAKEADLASLQEALNTQRFAAESANVKCRHFMKQEVKFTKEIEHLRTTLKSKEAIILRERDSINATNYSLLEDKRNLEEKQCTLFERIEKLEEELSALQAIKVDRCNTSLESNGPLASQISMKPISSNNVDPKPIACAGVIKKSSIIESAERRERRKTAHDEHRKQSFWNDLRNFGTMTEPEG